MICDLFENHEEPFKIDELKKRREAEFEKLQRPSTQQPTVGDQEFRGEIRLCFKELLVSYMRDREI